MEGRWPSILVNGYDAILLLTLTVKSKLECVEVGAFDGGRLHYDSISLCGGDGRQDWWPVFVQNQRVEDGALAFLRRLVRLLVEWFFDWR